MAGRELGCFGRVTLGAVEGGDHGRNQLAPVLERIDIVLHRFVALDAAARAHRYRDDSGRQPCLASRAGDLVYLHEDERAEVDHRQPADGQLLAVKVHQYLLNGASRTTSAAPPLPIR